MQGRQERAHQVGYVRNYYVKRVVKLCRHLCGTVQREGRGVAQGLRSEAGGGWGSRQVDHKGCINVKIAQP